MAVKEDHFRSKNRLATETEIETFPEAGESGGPGIQVAAEAANGREAVERALQFRPDVVVMDISMPEMDGIEATRLIKAELPDVRAASATTNLINPWRMTSWSSAKRTRIYPNRGETGGSEVSAVALRPPDLRALRSALRSAGPTG